jgi:hypothetical protein
MAELLGWAIGLGIVALLMLAGVLPIYFILKKKKKISGSKTTFAEDLQEAYTARPRPETLGMLSTLDSVESIILQVYKYVLIIGLVLGSVFIVWFFFIGVQNDSERGLLRLYFGAAYLSLVIWVVGSFVMIKRRQARSSPAGMTQTASPVPEPVIRASVDPALPPGVKAAPSKDAPPAPSALTPQQIVIVVMVFAFAVGTFSVILLMLKGLVVIAALGTGRALSNGESVPISSACIRAERNCVVCFY